MQIFLQLCISGISLGMIYAVIAFGYQLTFATSKTLNFGQGESLALGALVGLTVSGFVGYWAMLPIVLLFGMAQGFLVERLAVRPALRTRSEFGWVMATIALGIIGKNLAETIWGADDLKFPSPLSEVPIVFADGLRIMPMEILVLVGAIAMMLAIEAFNKKTLWGKAVVATADDRDAAGLMGINASSVITFSYGLSSAIAAFAGVLIAPLTLTGASMGAVLALKAFAVAIIGGLNSGLGVVVGGVLLGVIEQFTAFYVSTGFKDVPGLVLLLLVLAIKPTGLFGKAVIRKV
ncbi:branched-chain amino acid ABC transporter permease [Acidovorax sp.]|uniref:branched-chain amino acid ABC transporter permease n=1 Tax=Acidovorax sp. TaxID=1872122 RepID=UPI004037DDFB